MNIWILAGELFITYVFLISTAGVFTMMPYNPLYYPYTPFNASWGFIQLVSGVPFLGIVKWHWLKMLQK